MSAKDSVICLRKKDGKIVKDQRACFSCLKRSKGHTVANYSRKKECGEKHQSGSVCNKSHHKLLHIDPTVPPNPAHIGFIQDGGGTFLPVLVGQVKGENGTKAASVFYDSGRNYPWYVKALQTNWSSKQDLQR